MVRKLTEQEQNFIYSQKLEMRLFAAKRVYKYRELLKDKSLDDKDKFFFESKLAEWYELLLLSDNKYMDIDITGMNNVSDSLDNISTSLNNISSNIKHTE